jgi:hypothetical protein
VVAGRGGDDTGPPGFLTLVVEEVVGAADLERAGALQVLALEVERRAEPRREIVGMDQFGAAGTAADRFGGSADGGEVEHGGLLAGCC